jgi:chemotaxis protein CheD
MPETVWPVGIAELKTAKSPDRLSAIGLGSCVGVALWDGKSGWGALAHVMLPAQNGLSRAPVRGKFADTAVEWLLAELVQKGASPGELKAKLVGGSNMFNSIQFNPLPVGLRNVMACREELTRRGIPVVAEDVGGTRGRSIVFYPRDGRLLIRSLNQPERWL